MKKKLRLLLYCTKAKNKYDRLVSDEHYGKPFYLYGAITENFESLNGKIVAECDFEVEKIRKGWGCLNGTRYFRNNLNHYFPDYELEQQSCLSFDELDKYLKGRLNENCGYAIHIKNLHIFDEPKELSEYKRKDEFMGGKQVFWETIKKAPQNMMFAYDNEEKKILISIQSQWLCKILNGEKTIEVRKKVLKGMLK